MRIWLIQTGEPLPIKDNVRKMRTAHLAEKLSGKGHQVIWWTSAFDHFSKDWISEDDDTLIINDNYYIKTLKGCGYKANVSLARFIDHRRVAYKFRKISKSQVKPDIIVASYPPYDLAYQAVKYAKSKNIPVLVDVRDKWPDAFIDFMPDRMRKMAKSALFWDYRIAHRSLRMADGLISMMEMLLEWSLMHSKREKTWRDRVFYLGAEKIYTSGTRSKKIDDLVKKIGSKFVITFLGTFSNSYDPSICLQSARALSGEGIVFVLAGDGELFSTISKEADGIPNVIMPGWLNYDEMAVLLSYSHVGLCTAQKLFDAFPNKAFLYLSAGLPIVSAVQGEFKRILEDSKAGFSYLPGDLSGFNEHIKTLSRNPRLYGFMSRNAGAIFDKRFNADNIYEEYAEHVLRIAMQNKRS